MKAVDYHSPDDILSEISSKMKNKNLKILRFNNKYDNQPLIFAYDPNKKLCYNINISNNIIHAIQVKYNEFIDNKENFIF